MEKIAVGYVRYSSANQREESIEAQIRLIEEYAKKEGYVIISFYADHALSGTSTGKRLEFQRLMEDSKKGTFQFVLVHKLDRFSRSRYESSHYKFHLKKHGVKLISVLERLDESPESIILESVLEGMSEFYSRNLAREVRKGMTQSALSARHLGGKPALGYSVDRTTMKYVINEDEAEIVRNIFSMYLNGMGYGKLINYLNAHGHRTKWKKAFGKTAIYTILRNTKYKGLYTFNRGPAKDCSGKRTLKKTQEEIISIPNGIPAIISEEDFQKVQEKLALEKKKSGMYKAKAIYLLSGIVLCGKCGHSFHANGRIGGRNRTKYYTYRCSHRASNKDKCDNKEVNRTYLEDFVLSELQRVLFNERRIGNLARRLNEYQVKTRMDNSKEVEKVQKELSSINPQIQNILDAISQGMDHSTLKERLTTLESEKIRLQLQIKELEYSDQKPFMDEAALREILKRYSNFVKTRSIPECKKFVREFVEKVVVHKDSVEVHLKINIGKGVDTKTFPLQTIKSDEIKHYYRHNTNRTTESIPQEIK
ncbi:MAG: recombinase family protein [Candidatus Riflebacteria bacterium]|nr:recombinase family protein [Candidatus Riflebacteria bacterium]